MVLTATAHSRLPVTSSKVLKAKTFILLITENPGLQLHSKPEQSFRKTEIYQHSLGDSFFSLFFFFFSPSMRRNAMKFSSKVRIGPLSLKTPRYRVSDDGCRTGTTEADHHLCCLNKAFLFPVSLQPLSGWYMSVS